MRPSEDVEGAQQRDGALVLGTVAGPEKALSNLCHEMAHMVDIDDDRVLCHGWGLEVPTLTFPGHLPCWDPQTFQACRREINVFAIQRVIHEAAGLPFDDEKCGNLVYRWIPGACYIRDEFPDLPDYGEAPYEEVEAVRIARVTRAIRERHAELDPSWVRSEWDRKCRLVDEILRSRQAP